MRRLTLCVGMCGLLWMTSAPGAAQQVTVQTPLTRVNDSFYEHFNIGWGFRWQSPRSSFFFNFGGPFSAIPPFGGFDPAAGGRFGVAQRWGNGEFNFRFAAGQGRRTTLTMSAPSVTMMNGVPGSIRDTTVRPFVIGVIPVVGAGGFPIIGMPPMPLSPAPVIVTNPLTERLERLQNMPPGALPAADPGADLVLDADGAEPVGGGTTTSTAQRGDVSLAEIRRQQAAETASQREELEQMVREAESAERQGNYAIARVRYRQAAAQADGRQKQRLLDAALRLKGK